MVYYETRIVGVPDTSQKRNTEKILRLSKLDGVHTVSGNIPLLQGIS